MDEAMLLVRIEKLEKDVETLFKSNNSYSERLTRIETKQDYIISSMDKLEKAIQALSEKPAKRWDSVVSTVITVAITSVVAFFIGKLTGK